MPYEVKNGCRLWPDCYTCPFPDCIADERDFAGTRYGYHYTDAEKVAMVRHALELEAKGLGPSAQANEIGVDPKSLREWKRIFGKEVSREKAIVG